MQGKQYGRHACSFCKVSACRQLSLNTNHASQCIRGTSPSMLATLNAKVTMDEQPAIQKAYSNPFGRLPDTVLLYIFKDKSDRTSQQAAYKSCRDIRDFCTRNMKSVTVEIHSANSLKEVQRLSSTAMCPRGACGIQDLTLRVIDLSERGGRDYACTYLNQLIDKTFSTVDTHVHCRRKQLAETSSIKLLLTGIWRAPQGLVHALSSLLSHFPHLRVLHTNVMDPLLCIPTQHLQYVAFSSYFTAKELYAFAVRHPTVKKLEIVLTKGDLLQRYEPALQQFKHLEHLAITSLGSTFKACVLTGLQHLSTLALHSVRVADAHLLTQLNITRLILEDVKVVAQDQPLCQVPVLWPALRSVQFTEGIISAASIPETLARTFLPLPHPGFDVIWPDRVRYDVDAPPHPQFGLMGVAHMKSFVELNLAGQHVKSGMREIIHNRVSMQHLSVINTQLELASDEVANHIAFPTVVCMHLGILKASTPELMRQVFLQCPMLKRLHMMCGELLQKEELSHWLQPLGVDYQVSENGFNFQTTSGRTVTAHVVIASKQ